MKCNSPNKLVCVFISSLFLIGIIFLLVMSSGCSTIQDVDWGNIIDQIGSEDTPDTPDEPSEPPVIEDPDPVVEEPTDDSDDNPEEPTEPEYNGIKIESNHVAVDGHFHSWAKDAIHMKVKKDGQVLKTYSDPYKDPGAGTTIWMWERVRNVNLVFFDKDMNKLWSYST